MKKQIEGSLRLKLLTLLNLVGLVDFDDQLRISGIPSPKSEPLAIARSLDFPTSRLRATLAWLLYENASYAWPGGVLRR